MRLIAFGGDARMLGVLEAAKKAGWDTEYICSEADEERIPGSADAVVLPWPHSFRDGLLSGTQLGKSCVLRHMPSCAVLLHGSGVDAEEWNAARHAFDPAEDEEFLRANARLTAEGAIARAMERQGRALLGATVLITGFGRIAQELVQRLVAMDSFVIVCARNEMQMRSAHVLGAHPIPLAQIASAVRQADVIFNTVPAHILGKNVLDRIKSDALVIELASPPYGMNVELARHMGVSVAIESGLPGRYAPMDAGAAIFASLERKLAQIRSDEERSEANA